VWFLIWYLAGVVIVAVTLMTGIVRADGRDALTQKSAILPVVIGALVAAPIWPVLVLAIAFSAWMEHRTRGPLKVL
jgi:hypothetical protein